MASRKRMVWSRVAIVATLMIGVPPLSSAQDRSSELTADVKIGAARPTGARGLRRGELADYAYTPAPGAKDLKSALFNWAWYQGMLRSTEEQDLIMTLV